MSGKTPTKDKNDLLSKGLNFSVAPKRRARFHYCTGIESAASNFMMYIPTSSDVRPVSP